MGNLVSKQLPGVSFRQWLQDRAFNGSSAEVRRNAQRLLNTTGDDGRVDERYKRETYWSTGNDGSVTAPYAPGDQQGKEGVYGYDYNGLQTLANQYADIFQNSQNIQYGGRGNDNASASASSASTRSAGGYYGGGSNTAAAAAAAKEAQEKRFYESLLNALPGQKKVDSTRIDEKYDTSINDLSRQRKSGMGNLEREQNKLDRQRSKSYGQIQDDTQKILQGANTTLGMYGAGNSSATQMAAFGAADAANKQSGDITDQYNEQTGDIMVARKDLEDEFEQKKAKTDDWKKDQYHELDKEYRNLENNYRGRIGGQANLDAVVDTFKNMRAPEVKLKDLSKYKTDGLDKVDLTGQVQAPTLEPHQAQKFFTSTTTANKKKKEDDERDKADLLGL